MTLEDVYEELLAIVSARGARPDVPLEAESFFADWVGRFTGSKEELLDLARSNAARWFRWLDQPPRWIQDSEWQYSGGKPMVFLGQFDVPARVGLFHDEASIYVFMDETSGEIKTVTQLS